MAISPINAATDELRLVASDIGKLYGVSPVEIIVYAAAFELIQQMSKEEAQAVLADAINQLRRAGLSK
jgi:hypothetical protein